MKKICIVGAFDFTRKDTGGQPVKTRELYDALCAKYGTAKIATVETHCWKKHPIRMLSQILRNVPGSDRIIMLPAHNGLKVFSRLLQILKNREAKLYYDVIGGWLPEVAEKDPKLLKSLKKFDGIWVEATSMKTALDRLGLKQVIVVPNFKKLDMLKPEELVFYTQKPYRLCTFSRVMEEKGITDAIKAVCMANQQLGQMTYALDIYGPIAPQYEEKFAQLREQYSEFVCYKGVAAPTDSVKILKNYFALLFPTYYKGEGFAGTLLDAFAAGTPVIASDWRYNKELVTDGKTGILYSAKDVEMLSARLLYILQNVQWWNGLRENCLSEAKKYQPDEVIKTIVANIEDGMK